MSFEEKKTEEGKLNRFINTIWRNNTEIVFTVMVLLIILGSINIFSAGYILSEELKGTPFYFLNRHFISIIVGAVGLYFACRVDYHRWRILMPVFLGFLLVSLILVLLVGAEINGAKRWLFIFQPAEFAKLFAILSVASYIANKVNKGERVHPLNVQTIILIVIAVLVEMEPDMGTNLIIIGVPFCMLWIAGMDGKLIKKILLFGAVGVGILCVAQPYRLARIMIVMDPWKDAQNIGYQTVCALKAIGSGQLFGMGIGQGLSKYSYLPEAHTDFAIAVFSQEWGFVGALLIVALFLLLAYAACNIADHAPDVYGRFLAIGITLLIVGQASANMFMVSIGPVVGIPLPFISYGGTSLIVNMIAIGFLMNIGHQADQLRQKKLEAQAYLQMEEEHIQRLESLRPSRLRVIKH